MQKRFISEVRDYKKIALGNREEQFLQMITAGEKSAYDIYSELNQGETNKGKARTRKLPDLRTVLDDSISYKDVHKRVKRLETLGLIEPIQQTKQEQQQKKSKRKVIKYGITSRGLFQDLLGFQGWQWPSYRDMSIPLVYKNNVIIQTLLYQFFEVETIRELTSMFYGDWFFKEYLRKCCQGILELIDWGMYLEKEGAQPIPENQLSDIDWVIRRELDALILQIVKLSSNATYKDRFPLQALVKDEKLIVLVNKLRNDLHQGFKKILYANVT